MMSPPQVLPLAATQAAAVLRGERFERRAWTLDVAIMFVTAALSLLLLLYVAFGDARRTYERMQTDALAAEGHLVQTAVEDFVRADLPIGQFAGFTNLAQSEMKIESLLDAIAVRDPAGRAVFFTGAAPVGFDLTAPGVIRQIEPSIEIRLSPDLLQLVLPVRNRFEQVGTVELSARRRRLAARVEQAFAPLLLLMPIIALVFAVFAAAASSRLSTAIAARWIAGGFIAAFASMAIAIVTTLIALYAHGAQTRVESLADSLGQRLRDVTAYDLADSDISGLDALLGDYQRLNPDMRAAALLIDGRVRAHTDPSQDGSAWEHRSDDYEYTVALSPPSEARTAQVRAALPHEVVFRQVMRSVKNFAALLVASGLLASLFLELARSLRSFATGRQVASAADAETGRIALITPIFLLSVFAENLCYAFLPQLIRGAVASAGLPARFVSAPFVAYYLAFALALVPAGRLERRFSPRAIMIAGLTLSVLGMSLMALEGGFWTILAARAISGTGQGALFIGVQAYILAEGSQQRRTRSGSVIVFGFQAGMLAGIAIGSLLVASLQPTGVFALAAITGIVLAIYARMVVPIRGRASVVEGESQSLWRDIAALMRDQRFLKTMLLVGAPAKAVLTGVMLFGVPLLLTQQGFVKEDIGQITMLYAGAVMLGAQFVAGRADRTGDTRRILFQGTCLTALGLCLMSVMASPALLAWAGSPMVETGLVVLGAVSIGLAHGFINAPVVSHVVDMKRSAKVPATTTAATYRLLERLGHVLGPAAMAQLFEGFGQSWAVLGGIGFAVFGMGALFAGSPDRGD